MTTARIPSILTFALLAVSGCSSETPAVLTPAPGNEAPQVSAGAAQVVASGATVTLSGTAVDPDGTVASVLWTKVSGPEVVLQNPNQLTATFVAPEVLENTELLFRLSATDNEGATSSATTTVTVEPGADLPGKTLSECVIEDPRREVGAGLDAPGIRLEVQGPPVGEVTGDCAGNQDFRYGSGLYDITGVVANTSGMGWENPLQVFSALHTRLYSRAFVIESPCNDQRILFVSADIGLMWPGIRHGVLTAIAADEVLAEAYGPANTMLSVTHTHAGPAGYEHGNGSNLFHYGYDDTQYQTIVGGIVQSIRLAHANIVAHEESGPIRLAHGELLNTNINRSKAAFVLNPEEERLAFTNARGEEVQVNKRMVQLDLVRETGSAVGVINWFGVHPTVVGPTQPFVSSDIKGFASLGFERIMKTRYDADAGADNFVAAFAQADEGDSSPNIFVEEFPTPDPRRGGGVDDLDSNAISGTKHLARALELFGTGTPLSGPVDYRFFHVRIDNITVTDPSVLGRLKHPPEMDAEIKRTCSGALGASFGAGDEDGRGPTVEGARCDSDPDLLEAAFKDAQVLLNTRLTGFPGTWPAESIPPHVTSAIVMCNVTPAVLPGDFSCQAEKPVFLPTGSTILPFQLFRVGNFALLGLPWEVTTMSARRIRELMLEELAPAGIDTVVVAGLVNDYVHYLTTREEYSSQQYEGASNLFGPWTLAAVMQESRRLAQALQMGQPVAAGPAKGGSTSGFPTRPPYIPSDTLAPLAGTLVTDAPAQAAPGQTVRAEFVAGHPRNDLRIQSSYAYAERQAADGNWEVVATDRDPELLFIWQPLTPSPLPIDPPHIGPSTAAVAWTLPRNLPGGTYRLRHEGAARFSSAVPAMPYSGVSRPFTVTGSAEVCP
jgi:neutral ceramidase